MIRAETRNEELAVAELKELSPAFVAEIAHVPALTAVNVVPDIVQTEVVVELKLTEPVPDPPDVERVAVPPTVIADKGLIVSVA